MNSGYFLLHYNNQPERHIRMKSSLPASHVPEHDHQRCISSAVSRAESICERKGQRFTGLRKQVFKLVWSNHEPVTAYDLLKQLRREKDNAEPPTVYRALEFLQHLGLVHRIESLNAYIGCDHPDREHVSQFLICVRCNQAVEIADDGTMIRGILSKADELGFQVHSQTVEIAGTCRFCR